ncbi:MAG: CHRD domain-containing protein [Proteobacteria bacterium]|nr:CHRD domain-containing protein [Pseudomonadota bacterium]
MKSLRLLSLLAFVLAGCGMDYISEPAHSKVRFSAALTGEAGASGSLTAAYSTATHILQYRLSYGGLSGPVTWAFLDGPDRTGAPAEIVPINLADESNAHPGAATLTPQQAEDLLAGRWSVVLKTERYPGGELRGPIVRAAR